MHLFQSLPPCTSGGERRSGIALHHGPYNHNNQVSLPLFWESVGDNHMTNNWSFDSFHELSWILTKKFPFYMVMYFHALFRLSRFPFWLYNIPFRANSVLFQRASSHRKKCKRTCIFLQDVSNNVRVLHSGNWIFPGNIGIWTQSSLSLFCEQG